MGQTEILLLNALEQQFLDPTGGALNMCAVVQIESLFRLRQWRDSEETRQFIDAAYVQLVYAGMIEHFKAMAGHPVRVYNAMSSSDQIADVHMEMGEEQPYLFSLCTPSAVKADDDAYLYWEDVQNPFPIETVVLHHDRITDHIFLEFLEEWAARFWPGLFVEFRMERLEQDFLPALGFAPWEEALLERLLAPRYEFEIYPVSPDLEEWLDLEGVLILQKTHRSLILLCQESQLDRVRSSFPHLSVRRVTPLTPDM